MSKYVLAAVSILLMVVARPGTAADFALRDGDTVVFLGDSITAARGYGKVIENYTLLRYPQRKVRFINAGHGGDTAEGGLKRLERDVFGQGATVLTVAYGINDIGWGMKADAWEPGGPWDAQAGVVKELTEARDRITVSDLLRNQFLPERPQRDMLSRQVAEMDEKLTGLQRDIARPFPYHFEIRRTDDESKR